MRVLFYNWADYRDPQRRGGGISVYQRNLITALGQRDGIETAFLSAGLIHDLRPSAAPRIVMLEGGKSPRHTMINSGLVAPSHADFNGTAQITHPETEAAFAAFLERTGPWDIVHFNALEGLPANVLSLRNRWPQTRFILSLHNYYPFCAQVNLWHGERETCPGFDAGRRCATCLPVAPDPRSIRLAYAMETALERIGAGPGTVLHRRVFRPALGLAWRSLRRAAGIRRRLQRRDQAVRAPAPTPSVSAPSFPAHGERRRQMVALINTHCDAVLCVSDRVRQIARSHGLREDRLHTLRIGSSEASAWTRTAPRTAFLGDDGTLRLAYLGYMRRDKGYFFLMRALANVPEPMARRLHLTVAAQTGDTEAMALLDQVRKRLASVRHVDGYSHDELDSLLADVDLGVVPVLWEDNLPQVAIEMHARHIPVLASDRGGARELGRCDALVFRAGDAADLTRALQGVLDGRVTPAAYWDTAMAPVTMERHLDSLLALYRETA